MGTIIPFMWDWLGEQNNYNKLGAVAAVGMFVLAVVTLLVTLLRKKTVSASPSRGGEVWMSVEDLQAHLEYRG